MSLSTIPSRLWRSTRIWWWGRDYRLLLGAAPAVLAGAGVVGVGTALWMQPRQEVSARYLERAQACLKNEDYEGALTCYDRLVGEGETRPEVLFGLAKSAEALGEGERTLALMNELAPSSGGGYPEAHLWWAKLLLRNVGVSPEERKAAERHLRFALDGQLDDRAGALGLLGEVYLQSNRLEEAEPLLTEAVKSKPQLRLRLAQLFALRGDTDRARSEARLAANTFRAWAQADLQAKDARLKWAETVLFLEDHAAAADILRDGLAATGDAEYRSALSRLYVLWSDYRGREGKKALGERLDLLQKALEYDPSNPDLILHLWGFTKAEGEDGEKARAALREQVASGKSAAMAHLALGMDAWEAGKHDEALIHLEQAYRQAPQMAVVANNLAWVLANSQKPDLQRALDLINTVLTRFPNSPMFIDTRADILARMGKHREALTDLQSILPIRREDPVLHRRLAGVYEQLKMPEMAAQHQKQAEQLTAKQKPQP